MVVAQILAYIFNRLGIVNDEEIQAKESECRETVYGLMEPIVKNFDELEELQYFGTAAQNDYIDVQLIKFVLQIIKNTGKLKHDTNFWNIMLQADKIWANLKDYVEHTHQRLRTTRGNTTRSMHYKNTNNLTT